LTGPTFININDNHYQSKQVFVRRGRLMIELDASTKIVKGGD